MIAGATSAAENGFWDVLRNSEPNLTWLVVWNIWIIFPYIGNVIIPTDFHIFQRGLTPPTSYAWITQNQKVHRRTGEMQVLSISSTARSPLCPDAEKAEVHWRGLWQPPSNVRPHVYPVPKRRPSIYINLLFGGLDHLLFSHILGMSSSELTNSIIFQRGRYYMVLPPTSYSYVHQLSVHDLGPHPSADPRAWSPARQGRPFLGASFRLVMSAMNQKSLIFVVINGQIMAKSSVN